MNGQSQTPEQEKIAALRQILPEVFSEEKIDWEKLKATLGEKINFSNERYVLNWAGKSDAFRVLQTPTPKTLIPAKDESVNFDTTNNIFIEGENLEVLKVLQKSYFGRVKMIYIDPPYNTGNDSFIYPDKFAESLADYEKRVGDKDDDGYMTKDGMFRKNSKENGQYHSNWLNMMMPRLFLARNLLRDDGVIFVSIDDNEVHNLRLLMNEIFGEENFVDSICWKKKYGGGAKEKYLVSVHEYVLIYAKNLQELPEIMVEFDMEKAHKFYKFKDENFDKLGYYRTHPLEAVKSFDLRENLYFPITAPDGTEVYPKRQWRWSKERFNEALSKNEVIFNKNKDNEWVLSSKQYLNDENGIQRKTKAQSIFDDIYTQEGTKEIYDIFGDAKIFSFPKPINLINRLLEIGGISNNDMVFDFFAGSGVVAQAIYSLNHSDSGKRKYICVQLPELCDDQSEAKKAGYATIADIAKERIRRAGKKIADSIQEEINSLETQINKLSSTLTGENQEEIETLKAKIDTLQKQDLGFKVFKLKESNFKQWQQSQCQDVESLKKQMAFFVDPVTENATAENMAVELLLKSGFDLVSKVEQKNGAFVINGGALVLLLETHEKQSLQTMIDEAIATKPQKVIALDRLFQGNDQLKTNTVLQMRDAGIEFKTI